MKKLIYAFACTLAVASCNQDAAKKVEQVAQQQRDSLEQIISQKDNEINDMMTTLSDIEEGFREITEAQSRVTLAKQGEGTNTMQRIKENFQFIQTQMQQNKELINKLKQQVRESSVKGGQLKKIIDNLTQQLETKDKQLQALREELDRKDIHIAQLDEKVASLEMNLRHRIYFPRMAFLVRPRYSRRISIKITSPKLISVSTRKSNSIASRHKS